MGVNRHDGEGHSLRKTLGHVRQSNSSKTLERKLCEENGYSYEWKGGQRPNLIKNGKIVPSKCDNFVLVDVLVLSSDATVSGSADHSAKNTAKFTPGDQETKRASIDRLQHLPEWLEKFTENLVEPRSTEMTAKIFQNHFARNRFVQEHLKGRQKILHKFPKILSMRDVQAYENYKGSLQTHFTQPRTPRDQVR